MSDQAIQRISPVLVYDDADKAIRFITEAFGFIEKSVHRGDDGKVVHAELEYEGGLIGISERSGSASPFDLGPCALYVVVDDPDAHFEQSSAAGAEIVFPLTDQDYGSRDYAAKDPEGFVWSFGTYIPGSS